MGQTSSQLQEGEGEGDEQTNAGIRERRQSSDGDSDDHSTGDAMVVSSQINSSIRPTFSPPRHRNKRQYSSPPVSRPRSTQGSTPALSLKTVDAFPHKQPPPVSDHLSNLGDQATDNTFQPEEPPPSGLHSTLSVDVPDHGLAQEQEQDGVNGGDVDLIESTLVDAHEQTEVQSQSKQARKERKRAAKLAKKQAAAVSALEADEKSSQFTEIGNAQQRRKSSKRDKEEEGNQLVEHPDMAPKKRKRKRKSQLHVEDEPQQSAKKHKHLHNGSSGIRDQDEQVYNNFVENDELHHHIDVESNNEFKQIDPGHLQESHPNDDIPKELEQVTETGVELEDEVDADDQVKGEADGEVEEHRDDDIDLGYNNNGATIMASEVMSASPLVDRRHSSASPEGTSRLTYSMRNDGLVTTGIVQGEKDNSAKLHDAGPDEGLASSYMDDTAGGDIEIPSTMPHLRDADDSDVKQRQTARTSSRRKRVPKPDFFSRMENPEEISNSQSPSKAALARKEDNDKRAAVLANGTQPSQFSTDRKPRTPKTTTRLKNSPNPESNKRKIPSARSAGRSRASKTPLRSGTFGDSEIRDLNHVVDRFREDNDMTQHEVNDLIQGNTKEVKASKLWEDIVAACPGRARQRIINHIRRRFHNFPLRGKWTVEQDAELRQMYEQYGNKFAMIGQYLNRHPEDVRDRIRNYIICGDKLRKDQWSQEETNRLIAIVAKATTEIHLQRANRGLDESRPVEEDINWQLVSQGMNRTRSRLQCIAKWKTINPDLGGGVDGVIVPIENMIQQAREAAIAMSHHERALIIKEILKSRALADSRIPWAKVRSGLGAGWTRPQLMVAWFRLRRALPDWRRLDVKEVCTALLEEFDQTQKLEYPDEETGDIDYDDEYREIERRVKGTLKSKLRAGGAATGKTSANGDEEEEDSEEVLEETLVKEEAEEEEEEEDGSESRSEGAAEEAQASKRSDRSSVDLGIGDDEKEPEIEDSEPEANTNKFRYRRTRSTASRFKPLALKQDELDDDQSSDTNASQALSIPPV
ncbi:hypothetical protein F4861DRAFT_411209 [Xylaria intraflava]|nr:hypothetical protein F4861DRAFT_411209 [Xylaria intraflava]